MEDLFKLQIVLYKPSFELVFVKCLKHRHEVVDSQFRSWNGKAEFHLIDTNILYSGKIIHHFYFQLFFFLFKKLACKMH